MDRRIKRLTEEFESLGLIRPSAPREEEEHEEVEEEYTPAPRGRRLLPIDEMDMDLEDEEMEDEGAEGEESEDLGLEPEVEVGLTPGGGNGFYSGTPQSSVAGSLAPMRPLAGARTTEVPSMPSLPPLQQVGQSGMAPPAMESSVPSLMGDIRTIVERLGDPLEGDFEASQRIFENISVISRSLGSRLRESDPLRPTLFSLAEDADWYKGNVTKVTLESNRDEIEGDVKKMVLDLVDVVEDLREDIEEDLRSRGFRS